MRSNRSKSWASQATSPLRLSDSTVSRALPALPPVSDIVTDLASQNIANSTISVIRKATETATSCVTL